MMVKGRMGAVRKVSIACAIKQANGVVMERAIPQGGGMKAFLSHSSANKPYVQKVFEYLTASRAHYDSVTFESFQRSHEAIITALKDSDLFVFFASPESLTSPWVCEEVRTACDPASTGKLLERVVVLLGASRDQLPLELRQSTAIAYADPGLVARKLEELLLKLHSRVSPQRPFIGREDDLKTIASGIAPVGQRSPEFVLISGISGIGRNSLLSRTVRDNYPFISQTLRVIPVSKGAGPVDLYFAIRSAVKTGTVADYVREAEAFSALDEKGQIDALVQLTSHAVAERDPLVLDDSAWLMTDGGEIAPWFLTVLAALPAKPFPQILLISTRALSPLGRAALNGRFFAYVLHSLTKPNTTRLLWLLLQQGGETIDAAALESLVDAVDGHPEQVLRAAQLVVGGRREGATLRIREVVEALNRSAESLISLAELDESQFLMIKLFNEFEYMSVEDLAASFESVDRFEVALFGLLDLCFVEKVGAFLRLAPSVSRALVRLSEKHVNQDDFVRARRMIAERLNSLTGDDLVEFEVLENSVAAWIRSSEIDPPLKSAKMLLPASLLRCAQRSYDARDWQGASNFSFRALEGDWKLTGEAALEAFRLRGLSLARLGEDVLFDALLSSLHASEKFINVTRWPAERMEHFLVAFKARLDGDYQVARVRLEKILAIEKRPNFSILREYSDVLVKLGELDRAMDYSRQALEIASSNPYVLAMAIDIIDKKASRDGETSQMAIERRDLFDRLRRADEAQRTSFSLLREARQRSRAKDYAGALELLRMAEADRDSDPIVVALERARVLLHQGDYDRAFNEAESARKHANATLGRRAIDFFGEVDEIKIRARIEQGRILEAQSLFDKAKRIDAFTSDELTRMMGFAQSSRGNSSV